MRNDIFKIAKYHKMTRHQYYSTTFDNIKRLDKKVSRATNIDFPLIIPNLHESTKKFNIKTNVKEWFYDHTSSIYYTFFSSEDHRDKIFKNLLESNSGIMFSAGKSASVIKDFVNLRFCQYCVEEDLNKIDISSWYLIHQLPGVFFCPIHNRITYDSKFSRLDNLYELPNQENCKVLNNFQFAKSSSEKLFQISYLTWEILNSREVLNMNGEILRESYIGLLKKVGYGSYHTNLKVKFILSDIEEYYGQTVLQILYENHNFKSDDLTKLWSQRYRTIHPLIHIILINFILAKLEVVLKDVNIIELMKEGRSLYNQDSYNLKVAKKKFVCLNHFCKSYMRSTHCKVKHNISLKKIIFQVHCNKCGFVYRKKNLPSDFKEYKWDHVLDIGENLKKRIIGMRLQENLSDYKIAKILKMPIQSVKVTLKVDNVGEKIPFNNKKYNQDSDRQEWVRIMKNNPNVNKTKLAKENYPLYKRLYRYDKEWLNSLKYHKNKNTTRKTSIDWLTRDLEYLKILQKTTDQIKLIYPPKKITLNSLIKEAKVPWEGKYKVKLPISYEFIQTSTEDNDKFTIRKARMVLERQKTLPLPEQFMNSLHLVGQ